MPDYARMQDCIRDAEHAIDRAIDSMHTMDKMTQLESYVLAFLRAAQSVLEKAREAIEQATAKRRPASQNESDKD